MIILYQLEVRTRIVKKYYQNKILRGQTKTKHKECKEAAGSCGGEKRKAELWDWEEKET